MDSETVTTRGEPRFGGFRLDPGRAALVGPDGAEIALRPKTYALLQLLAAHAGRLVERETILDAVWPGLAVTDDSITQCIGEIRRALGEAGPRLLRTVPRRGYILEAAPAAEPAPAPDLLPDSPIVPEMAAAETAAARTAPPETAPRTVAAIAAPRSAPRALRPALLGLALALLAAVGLSQLAPSTPADPAPRRAAMPLYEQGRALAYRASGSRVDNLLAARQLFEQAIAADPAFAAAYAEVALTHTNMVVNGLSLDPAAELRRGGAMAEAAVAQDPRLGTAYSARAAVLRAEGRPAEALEAYRHALALDRTQHASRANIGLMLILLGRPQEAEEPVLRSLALAEADHAFTGTWYTYLGTIDLQLGRGDHGAGRFRAALERRATMPPDTRRLYLAAALALTGQLPEAQRLVLDVRGRQPALTAAALRRQEPSAEAGYQRNQANLYRGLALAGLPD